MNQRRYCSEEDLKSITKLVKENSFKRIYITGDVQTGKSCFCRKFEKLTGCEFIELDKERDKDIKKSRNEVLAEVIEARKNGCYILEHYDLLSEDYMDESTLSVWKEKAEILILLNSKGNGVININEQKNNFDQLHGKIIYCNPATRIYVKHMMNQASNQPD